MGTIFDKILAKKIPADVVYEDDQVLAFKDINPQTKVHVLVIPKSKLERFSDLQHSDDKSVGQFFRGVSRVASELGLDDDGYRVILNCGKHGCQTVEYIHAHIMGGQQLLGWDIK